jgi:hypothetical protein
MSVLLELNTVIATTTKAKRERKIAITLQYFLCTQDEPPVMRTYDHNWLKMHQDTTYGKRPQRMGSDLFLFIYHKDTYKRIWISTEKDHAENPCELLALRYRKPVAYMLVFSVV